MQEGDFGRILLYNKPDGEVTTRHDPEGRKTVFETLPRLRGSRWIAVGRLDINTQGLLVFTTNGDLAQKLMHPENEFEREYLCRVHGEVTEEIVAQLLAGVELEDGPAAVSLIESMDSAGGSNEWWRVVIKEGRNREIRRLWEAVGLTVSRLKRASFGPFTLPKGLHRGELAELDLEDTQKICIEMGISQTPSQLIAEDESASRLRRNRIVGEGVEGKKRFVAAGKGKAEAFWTGERGYGGAGSRPVRAGGGEFDLGGAPGSERPRDGRPKRGKGPMRGRAGAGRAAFVGPMGMSSFDVNAQSLGGPNSGGPNSNSRSARGPRANAMGGNAAGANLPRGNPTGPRNDRRGQRRSPNPATPLVDADGAPILSGDGQTRFAPKPNRHRSGPRPAGGRPHNTPQDIVAGQEPAAPAAERSRSGGRGNGVSPNQVPRDPGVQRPRGPRRDGGGPRDDGGEELIEKLVHINRVSKTVKGGKRFGFAALVVVGDGKGRAGFGHGKAREVPEAISKATAAAKKKMIRVPLRDGRTLHHDGNGHFGAGRVTLRSAPQGTGIIAGGPMRAIFESLGVADVVTKSVGTSNPYNMIRATFEALGEQTSPKSVAQRRGKKIADLLGNGGSKTAEADAVMVTE